MNLRGLENLHRFINRYHHFNSICYAEDTVFIADSERIIRQGIQRKQEERLTSTVRRQNTWLSAKDMAQVAISLVMSKLSRYSDLNI